MRRFLKLSISALLVIFVLLAMLGFWLSDSKAAVPSKPALNFSDLKRMQSLWEKYQPAHLAAGSRYVLGLTERELNLALALALAQYGIDENINIRLESTAEGVVTYFSYPVLSSPFRYLNVKCVWQVVPGEFPQLTGASISDVQVPDMVIKYINNQLETRIPATAQQQWQQVRLTIVPTSQGANIGFTWYPALGEQLGSFDIGQDQVKAAKFLGVINQVNDHFEDRSEIQDWMAAILDATHPQADELKVFLTVVAQYVAGNSVSRLFDLSGQDPASIRFYLSGHRDLARHFVFSALLAAQTTVESAKQVGLFKELSDSDNKDSGYSGIDLLANQAGISFYVQLAKAIDDDVLDDFVRRLKNHALMLDKATLKELDGQPREFWSQTKIDELLSSIDFFAVEH